MRRALALVGTALAAMACGIILVPPALSGVSAKTAEAAPFHAQLQLEVARAALQQDDEASVAAAAGFAHRSLAASPYNQPALAIAIEAKGVSDPVSAANIAAALGWRDTLANRRIARLALAANNMQIAAQRVDAIGRTRGGQIAVAAADRLMETPDGAAAMAERANLGPGAVWWIVYLRRPPITPEAQEGRLAFARALDRDNGPWLRDLVVTISGSLTGPEAPRDSFELWRDTLADPSQFASVLYDGAFSRFGDNTPAVGGEWVTRSGSPFAAERSADGLVLTPVREAGGAVIAQRFEGATGRHRLSARGDDGGNSLQWRIQCSEGEPVLATGTIDGRWLFTLPENCATPAIILEALSDKGDSGTAQISEVTIETAP